MSPPDTETLAENFAADGRDELITRFRDAYTKALGTQSDLVSFDSESIETMVQRAVADADGLQWRRAIAGVAARDLGIDLGAALVHPAVVRAHQLTGAPTYESALSELAVPVPAPPIPTPPVAPAGADLSAAPVADLGPAPVVAEPVVAEPVVAEPVVAEPVVPEPEAAEPAVLQPAVPEPVAAEPEPEAVADVAEPEAGVEPVPPGDDVEAELLADEPPGPVESAVVPPPPAGLPEPTLAEPPAEAVVEPEPEPETETETETEQGTMAYDIPRSISSDPADAPPADQDLEYLAEPADEQIAHRADEFASEFLSEGAGAPAADADPSEYTYEHEVIDDGSPDGDVVDFTAVHLGGVATLPSAEEIQIRLSEEGLDLLLGDGDIVGRLTWSDIAAMEVTVPHGRRRRRGAPRLVVHTAGGSARFEVPELSGEELQERVQPLMERFGH